MISFHAIDTENCEINVKIMIYPRNDLMMVYGHDGGK
jgi:hypothetical protein